jgi:ATP-dependent DNA helicase 2 subunit 2
MYQLPFMEDLRQYHFGSLTDNPKHKPSAPQLDAMDDLISSMELDDDELQTTEIGNPVIQRTFQCLEHRAMNPNDPLPGINPALERLFQPSDVITTRCRSQVLTVKNLFSLTKVEKKTKSADTTDVWKKTHDIILDDEAPPTKRAKSDEADGAFSVATLVKGDVGEVGAVNPVEDYRQLLATNEPAVFAIASKQLQKVILSLIKETFFAQVMHSKALESLKEYRHEAINCSDPDHFNQFLKQIRDDLVGTRYAPFWDLIVEEEMSLITTTECSSSNVSDEDARKVTTLIVLCCV